MEENAFNIFFWIDKFWLISDFIILLNFLDKMKTLFIILEMLLATVDFFMGWFVGFSYGLISSNI